MRLMTPHFGKYLITLFLALQIVILAALASAWLVSAGSALTESFSLSAVSACVDATAFPKLAMPLCGFVCVGAVIALIGGAFQFPLGTLARRLGGGHTPFIALGGVSGIVPPLILWSILGHYIRHGGWGSWELALFALLTVGSFCIALTAMLGAYSFSVCWFRRVFLVTVSVMILALYAVGWATPRFAMGRWITTVSGSAELDLKGPQSVSTFIQYGDSESNENPRVFWQETGRTLRFYQDDRTHRCLATGEISPDAKTITLHMRQPFRTLILQRYES